LSSEIEIPFLTQDCNIFRFGKYIFVHRNLVAKFYIHLQNTCILSTELDSLICTWAMSDSVALLSVRVYSSQISSTQIFLRLLSEQWTLSLSNAVKIVCRIITINSVITWEVLSCRSRVFAYKCTLMSILLLVYSLFEFVSIFSTTRQLKLPPGDTTKTTQEINLCSATEFSKIRGKTTPSGNFKSSFKTCKCGYYEKTVICFLRARHSSEACQVRCHSKWPHRKEYLRDLTIKRNLCGWWRDENEDIWVKYRELITSYAQYCVEHVLHNPWSVRVN
jgi:hypothetical protein